MRELQAQAVAKVEAAIAKAEEHFGKVIPRIPVEFSNKLTKTAGYFRFRANRLSGEVTPVKIQLSNSIMALNPEEFVADTPGHEAAHYIATFLFGYVASGHGYHWKQVMRVIGQEPTRCHQMKTVDGPKRKQYRYIDSKGGEHYMSAQRHNKLQHRGATYTVRSTKAVIGKGNYAPEGQPLRPTQVVEPKPAPVAKPTAPKQSANFSKPEQIRQLIAAELAKGYTRDAIKADMTLREEWAKLVGITKARAGVLIRDNINKA